MLNLIPPLAAHLMVFKISTYLCRLTHKVVCFDQIQKTQPCSSTVECQLTRLFKILKFSRPSRPVTTSTTQSIHSNVCPAPFPVWGGGYYESWWSSYPFRADIIWLLHLNKSLTKLNNKIWLTKSDQYKNTLPWLYNTLPFKNNCPQSKLNIFACLLLNKL